MKINTAVSALCSVSVLLASADSFAQQLYRITDLKTLGGRTTVGVSINATGQVTGESTLASGARRAFYWNGRKMVNVGTLGGTESHGSSINNDGHIGGVSTLAGGQYMVPFIWDGFTMRNLGTLGFAEGNAIALNNNGQMTGTVCGGNCRAYLWDGTEMRNLGTLPGGASSFGNAINTSGQVAGTAYAADGNVHAFLWDGTRLIDLGTLSGGVYSDAQSLNASGQVTGSSSLAGGETVHAFVWNGTAMVDLGVLGGGDFSEGHAINAAGQITGGASISDDTIRAFLWDGLSMRNLGVPPNGKGSLGRKISPLGHVLGDYTHITLGLRPFLWDGVSIRDLNATVDPSDPLKKYVILKEGRDINRRGHIVVTGNDKRVGTAINTTRTYVLTPMEYQLEMIAPAASSHWTTGRIVRISGVLADANGVRISDARATSLLESVCNVKFAATGAQSLAAVCMNYDPTKNEFFFNWKLGASGSGATTLKIAATYKFSMPQTITTSRSRTIIVTQ